MIPRVKPEGMLFGKPLHTFPDHALVQRQFGQRSTVNREGLAQTGSERAVASPKMLVFDLFRAIGRQPSEHLAVGRRSVIALKSFLPSVCNGRTHSGPLGGLCFLCAAARGALTSLRAKFGIFAAKPHTLRKVYAAPPSGTLRHLNLGTLRPHAPTRRGTASAQGPTLQARPVRSCSVTSRVMCHGALDFAVEGFRHGNFLHRVRYRADRRPGFSLY